MIPLQSMSHFRPSSSSRSTSEESVNKRIVANFHELGLLSTDEKRRGVPRQKQKQTYRRTVDRSYSNGKYMCNACETAALPRPPANLPCCLKIWK